MQFHRFSPPAELTEVTSSTKDTRAHSCAVRAQFYIIKFFEIGNENIIPGRTMRRTSAHYFVTRSLESISNDSLDLSTMYHYNIDEIESAKRQNCWMQQMEHGIDGNSSKPFRVS